MADAEHPRFAEILVDAGFKLDHPALVARLEGNDSYHLVLAGQDRDFTQRISIYRIEQGDGAEATLVAQLSPEPDLIAYDVARIGDRDWYFDGAMQLLGNQADDGSWGRLEQSCFALLFLKKAVTPVYTGK